MDKIIIKMKKEVSDKIIEICDRFNSRSTRVDC